MSDAVPSVAAEAAFSKGSRITKLIADFTYMNSQTNFNY